MTAPKHPAKFSAPIMEGIVAMLDRHGWPRRILDPFAGTGRVHELNDHVGWRLEQPWSLHTVGVEIEPDWAVMHPQTIVANARGKLPFPDGTFDCMVTSPCYGSRMADHHNARDGSVRRSYTHDIGHHLHPDNAGTLHWGPAYRLFHQDAWTECLRVLQAGALLIVNVSNFIRGGVEQLVTEWHLDWFLTHHCQILDLDRVNTARMRYGANREARPRWENLLVLRYRPPLDPEEHEQCS